jgi:hypothetical protein
VARRFMARSRSTRCASSRTGGPELEPGRVEVDTRPRAVSPVRVCSEVMTRSGGSCRRHACRRRQRAPRYRTRSVVTRRELRSFVAPVRSLGFTLADRAWFRTCPIWPRLSATGRVTPHSHTHSPGIPFPVDWWPSSPSVRETESAGGSRTGGLPPFASVSGHDVTPRERARSTASSPADHSGPPRPSRAP